MGHERDQDGWLGVTLRQSPATAPDACPDAETLAAWADGGLDAKATASVDLHASACSRCMAVLAAMERTAPAAPARHAWTPARLFRWLAPLAAAATAVAIWIAVPDRPTVPVVPAPAQDFQASRELGTANPAPSTKNPEPRESAKSASEPERQLRDDFKRERAESAIGATAAAAPAAPSAQEAPATAAAADALAGSAAPTALRSALNKTAPPAESAAPSNPLIRWRVVASTSIERSMDGGKTWTGTTTPALSVVAIRAVDGDRAVVRTSDGTEFYTTNGGLSWMRVQENSAAPF